MKLLSQVNCCILALSLLASLAFGHQLRDDFNARIDLFIEENLPLHSCDNIWLDVLKLEFANGSGFCQEAFLKAAQRMNERDGGVDFSLAAFSWLFNRHWNHPELTEDFKSVVLNATLNLPFWMNETGDFNTMQFWSENHQIGWKAGKYLIGQAFALNPDLNQMRFEASKANGSANAELGSNMVKQWLQYRARFGFSEFNSDTYGPIAFKSLASVVALAQDAEIKQFASMVLNLQIFDHILGSKGRRLSTARGRAYTEGKIDTHDINYLYFTKGLGKVPRANGESAMLALAAKNGYEFPLALLEIGEQIENGVFEYKERFGLDPKDGAKEGIFTDNPEDCIFWFSDGAYFDPSSPECIFLTGDAYDLWDRTEIWGQIKPAQPLWNLAPNLVTLIGQETAAFGGGSTLGTANVYTYRTPDYMLSSVQNYHPGWVIGQQHPWQATLDPKRAGTFFSHQPLTNTPDDEHDSMYWVLGAHPKVGQFGTTLISLHNPDVLATLVFGIERTHANFNKLESDEFVQVDQHWFFAKQGSGFVGMYSNKEASFENGSQYDLVAQGIQNVWICEVGSIAEYGTFDNFTTTILNSTIEVSYTFNGSFIECMIDNQCLSSGVEAFFDCILNKCADFFKYEEAFECIHAGESLSAKLACVSNARKSDIQVRYSKRNNEEEFTFGWSSPLTLNGVVVQNEENYPRMQSAFTSTIPWGSKVFNISSSNFYLSMDFNDFW